MQVGGDPKAEIVRLVTARSGKCAAEACPYNFPTMPRWLIAVFTLHFLLSVGAPVFGKVPPAEHLRQSAALVVHAAEVVESATALSPDSAPQDLGAEGEHGLTDAQQDLSDDQNIRIFSGKSVDRLCRCPMVATSPIISPLLKKQPKPPRASMLQT